jgi:hypothetical protein
MGCSTSKRGLDVEAVEVRVETPKKEGGAGNPFGSAGNPFDNAGKSAAPAKKRCGEALWARVRAWHRQELPPLLALHVGLTRTEKQVSVLCSLLSPTEAESTAASVGERVEAMRNKLARLQRLEQQASELHFTSRARHFWQRNEKGWRDSTRFDWRAAWVEKKPVTGGSVLSTRRPSIGSAWRRRFLVLQPDRIAWHKAEEERYGKPKGELVLTPTTVARVDGATETVTIVVRTAGKGTRQLTLKGEGLVAWAQAITAAVGILSEPKSHADASSSSRRAASSSSGRGGGSHKHDSNPNPWDSEPQPGPTPTTSAELLHCYLERLASRLIQLSDQAAGKGKQPLLKRQGSSSLTRLFRRPPSSSTSSPSSLGAAAVLPQQAAGLTRQPSKPRLSRQSSSSLRRLVKQPSMGSLLWPSGRAPPPSLNVLMSELREGIVARAADISARVEALRRRFDLCAFYSGGVGADGAKGMQQSREIASAVAQAAEALRRLEEEAQHTLHHAAGVQSAPSPWPI